MAQWMCLLRMESSMWVVIFCMRTQVDQLPAKRLVAQEAAVFSLSLSRCSCVRPYAAFFTNLDAWFASGNQVHVDGY